MTPTFSPKHLVFDAAPGTIERFRLQIVKASDGSVVAPDNDVLATSASLSATPNADGTTRVSIDLAGINMDPATNPSIPTGVSLKCQVQDYRGTEHSGVAVQPSPFTFAQTIADPSNVHVGS